MPGAGVSLRQAALVAGCGLLIMHFAGPFAEFLVWSELVVAGEIESTVQNFRDHRGLYLAGVFAYLLLFIMDVVVAWALYVLLRPVNQPLALLTAWFRLVYTALALFASFKLVVVYRLLQNPDYATMFGSDGLHAQVALHLNAFRHEWDFSLILFGIYLLLLAWLVYRAPYLPRFTGILLAVAGLGWMAIELAPYLLPGVDVDILFATIFGETVFMLWLLLRGSRIPEPDEGPELQR